MTTRGDLASGGLSVQGTPDQVKLGAWLFAELDKSAPVAADTAVHEYRLADGKEKVRVFFLDRGQTVDELREFVTMLRNIADLPRAFACNTIKTVVLRGTSDRMALADWFVNELATTKPAPRQHSESPEYLLPADPSPAPISNGVRIFYFASTPAILDFYQVTSLILALTDIQRMFTYKTPRAFAVRGASDQVALAEWLFNEVDQPARLSTSHRSDVYNYRGFDWENALAIRVFYLPQIGTVQEFQRIAERRTERGEDPPNFRTRLVEGDRRPRHYGSSFGRRTGADGVGPGRFSKSAVKAASSYVFRRLLTRRSRSAAGRCRVPHVQRAFAAN